MSIESSILELYPNLETGVIKSGESQLRYFFLPSGFKDIGRALVFGYLETDAGIEFHDLVRQLTEKARRLGAVRLVGPLNFSTFLEYRLKLDHFEDEAFPGEPGNSSTIVEAFQREGFRICKKYYSHEFDTRLNLKFHLGITLTGWWAQVQTWSEYQFVSLRKENYLSHIEAIYSLTLATFSENFLFQKIPYLLFKRYFETQWLPVIDLDTSLLVLNRTGKLVGYSLCLVDRRNSKRLLFKTVGVERSERRGGLLAIQILRRVYLQARKRYQYCLACLMIEGNKVDTVTGALSVRTTSYGLFEKNINQP